MELCVGLACFAWMFGVLGRISVGPSVSIHVLDVCVAFLSISIVCKRIQSQRKLDELEKAMIVWFGIACMSLGLASTRYSTGDIVTGGLYLVRLVAYVPLVWLFQETRTRKKTFEAFFTVSALGTVALGYVQYGLYPDLRNLYWAGWDEHLYRFFGTQLDPNFMGALLCVYALWFGMLIQRITKTQNIKSRYRKILYSLLIMSIVLSTLGIILTFSRGAYLMASVITFLVVKAYKPAYLKYASIIAPFIIGGIILVAGASEGTKLLRTASIHARLREYAEAYELFIQRPILGHGYNMYRYVATENGFVSPATWRIDHAGAGVPQSYLFILVTTGIVGGVAGLRVLWLLYGRIAHNTLMRSLCIGLGVHALTENSLVYPYILFPVLVLISYVADNYAEEGSLRSSRLKDRDRNTATRENATA